MVHNLWPIAMCCDTVLAVVFLLWNACLILVPYNFNMRLQIVEVVFGHDYDIQFQHFYSMQYNNP